MAGLMVLLNLISVISNYGKTDASGFAVFSLLASIWAFGIFANFRQDPMNAPGYAVMLSTASLAIAAALVGSLAMLRRRALVGDAVAHASLPGICLAWFVAGDRSLAVLLMVFNTISVG